MCGHLFAWGGVSIGHRPRSLTSFDLHLCPLLFDRVGGACDVVAMAGPTGVTRCPYRWSGNFGLSVATNSTACPTSGRADPFHSLVARLF